jgi:hypothetical protein
MRAIGDSCKLFKYLRGGLPRAPGYTIIVPHPPKSKRREIVLARVLFARGLIRQRATLCISLARKRSVAMWPQTRYP